MPVDTSGLRQVVVKNDADSISFAQRVAGIIIVTDGDPLFALAYAVTAGVSGPFVVITNSKHAVERSVVLQAGAIACLTIYDMLKAVDRGMVIGNLRLVEKSGGKSGTFKAD